MGLTKNLDKLRKIVMSVRDKLRRLEDVNETSSYIDDTTILVNNTTYKSNVVDGLRDGTTINFKENKDTTLYIYNTNCESVTIEGELIPLSKNKVNILEYRYAKGQWFVDVKAYPNSILEGLVASYSGNMIYKDVILRGTIKNLPDLSGNGYNIKGTGANAGRVDLGVCLGYKSDADTPSMGISAIRFDVLTTEINEAKITLDSLDYSKGFTLYLGGYCTPLSGASREYFQLGDSSNPSLTNGIVGLVEADTKLTLNIYDNDGNLAVTSTVDRGNSGMGADWIVTYNPTDGKVVIYNKFVQVSEGTINNWDCGKDLLIGNSFVPTSNSYMRARAVKIWNRVLTQSELDYIKNVDLRNKL